MRERRTLPSRVLLLVSAAGLFVAPARGQVDCSNPDNLCTGDPCVIPAVEVQSPCVADFGARTLVVGTRLRAPRNGVVDLTAGTIDVDGPIAFRRHDGGPRASLTLRAVGAITVNRPISSPGALGGLVLLDAGSIEVRGPVRVQGRLGGGQIVLSAAGPILMAGALNASGFQGRIEMTAGTDITIERPIRARDAGSFLSPPGVLIGADGQLVVGATIRAKQAEISLRGDAGVVIGAIVDARLGPGVDVSSASGGVVVDGRLDVSGLHGAGDVTIDVAGVAAVDGSILANGGSGSIRIEAASAQTGSIASLSATGGNGEIRLRADPGDLVLGGQFSARGGDGIVECSAGQDLTASARFAVNPVGCVALAAGGMLDTTGSSFDVPLAGDCPGSPSGAFLE